MTTKRIIWELPDGSIVVSVPAPGGRQQAGAADEQAWLERVAARARATLPYLRESTRLPDTEAHELPAGRFRDCWRRVEDGTVQVHLPLAREQRMAEIRAERNRRLQDSDGPMARANEIGTPEDIAALKAMRQALRDVPQAVDLEAVESAEALEAFEPDWPGEAEG